LYFWHPQEQRFQLYDSFGKEAFQGTQGSRIEASKKSEEKAANKVAASVCSKNSSKTVHDKIMSGDINLTIDKFQELWYKAIVSIGAASSTVENKDLRALLEFTAHNGSALWSRQSCFQMSRVRFTQLKYKSFCKMIKSTQLFPEFCRDIPLPPPCSMLYSLQALAQYNQNHD
jgi:hypothetical protein